MIAPEGTGLRGRLLGRELRRVREAAGMTTAELAARTRLPRREVVPREGGAVGSPVRVPPAHEHDLWCRWDDGDAARVLNLLCRNAVAVDVLAPFGIHPALPVLDPARCTAYLLEGTTGRDDVTARVIPRDAGAYPGVECHPVTCFGMADGAAVVFYAHPHAALFTDDPCQVREARGLFARLAGFTGP